MKKSLFSVFLVSSFALPVMANTSHTAHNSESPQINRMQNELIQSMAEMHDEMSKGMMHEDADIAFAASMIPHHQGAIKMAEVELKYGKDPELRKLAQAIIEAQEHEIKFMGEWLKKNKK